ncbi:MAG: hypothetical protein J6U56_00020 [Spirochaetia bacterium]|nr:hypothetical protein [Spirochaetia bacterium]
MKANRWLCLFLAICLVFTLAACGGGGGGSDDPSGGGNNGGNGGGNSAPAGPWLCFTAIESNSSISTTNQGGTVTNTPSLEYSTDGETWELFDLNNVDPANNKTVTLANAGDKVYLRATGTNDSFSENLKYIKFKMTGSIAASGNIMSLLDKDCISKVIPSNYCFQYLFGNCSVLVTAPELPATTLTYKCYYNMFCNCTALTTAPDLPATTLTAGCYWGIFSDCSSLAKAPALPATNLAEYCYSDMFRGCSALITAPALPATNLAEYCYSNMFSGCSALMTAPILPATDLGLANSCYERMFSGCSKLSSITVHFTKWVDAYWSDATDHWVEYVSYGGHFYCPGPGAPGGLNVSTKDESHVPPGWTVHDVNDP